jgi:Ni,Fe-hydrogenase I cytochrome b subunit
MQERALCYFLSPFSLILYISFGFYFLFSIFFFFFFFLRNEEVRRQFAVAANVIVWLSADGALAANCV